MISNVFIVGHRGMGVTAKPEKNRGDLLEGAKNFPENSLAAFKEAIRLGADGLEFDIVVSKDGHAMIIHSETLADYAHFSNFENVGEKIKTVGAYSRKELQESFYLKSISQKEWLQPKVLMEKIEPLFEGDELIEIRELVEKIQLSEELSDEEKKLKVKVAIKLIEKRKMFLEWKDWYFIPALEELFEWVANENNQRKDRVNSPIKLNIELKGQGSAVATLKSIISYNKQASVLGKPKINPDDIIILGRAEGDKAEIVIAKNLLRKASKILDLVIPKKIIPSIFNQNKNISQEEARIRRIYEYNEEYQKRLKEKSEIIMRLKKQLDDFMKIKRREFSENGTFDPKTIILIENYEKDYEVNKEKFNEGKLSNKLKSDIWKSMDKIRKGWTEIIRKCLSDQEKDYYSELQLKLKEIEASLKSDKETKTTIRSNKEIKESLEDLFGSVEFGYFFEKINIGSIDSIEKLFMSVSDKDGLFENKMMHIENIEEIKQLEPVFKTLKEKLSTLSNEKNILRISLKSERGKIESDTFLSEEERKIKLDALRGERKGLELIQEKINHVQDQVDDLQERLGLLYEPLFKPLKKIIELKAPKKNNISKWGSSEEKLIQSQLEILKKFKNRKNKLNKDRVRFEKSIFQLETKKINQGLEINDAERFRALEEKKKNKILSKEETKKLIALQKMRQKGFGEEENEILENLKKNLEEIRAELQEIEEALSMSISELDIEGDVCKEQELYDAIATIKFSKAPSELSVSNIEQQIFGSIYEEGVKSLTETEKSERLFDFLSDILDLAGIIPITIEF